MIENALAAGFTSVGMDVLLTGPIPTPGVAMLTRSMRADLGVMISASHNLYDDNGIKLFGPDGYKLSDEIEKQIEELIDSDTRQAARQLARSSAAPGASTACRTATSSSPSARCRAPCHFDGMRVVIDCANGAAYKVAPEALWELGAEVFASASSRTASTSTRMSARPRPTALGREGARDARRHRHRARRRRRPRRDRGREGPRGRRRPAAGRGGARAGRRTAGWRSPPWSRP